MSAWRVKKRRAERAITSIKNGAHQTVYSADAILDSFRTFYSDLYRSKKPQIGATESFLKDQALLKPLSEDHKAMMEAPITADELARAISHMKANKAPGPDGYPAEFYKAFAPTLIPAMLKIFNSIMETGTLPPSWKDSLLIPILKPDKEVTSCASYRPIALLNVDAKLFTSILSTRLQQIISCYVKHDQTGFIPVRSMADNIRQTLDLIHHAKSN